MRNRAVVFDLDDTLYPYHAFLRSGFVAVARHLQTRFGLSSRRALDILRRASADGCAGREVQALCAAAGLDGSVASSLVNLIREHAPALRLPSESIRVLESLRPSWKIGILTNGSPRIQRRKVKALGVTRLVDAVVFAVECGDGRGKPSPAAFATMLARLRVRPNNTVFVGDDVESDMHGAHAAGLLTIHLTAYRTGTRRCGRLWCRAHLVRLSRVPDVADRLLSRSLDSRAL